MNNERENTMNLINNKKTMLYKTLSIIILALGLGLLTYGMVEYIIHVSTNTTPLGMFDRPLLIIYGSSPLLFLGFFLFILGWGKKNQNIR